MFMPFEICNKQGCSKQSEVYDVLLPQRVSRIQGAEINECRMKLTVNSYLNTNLICLKTENNDAWLTNGCGVPIKAGLPRI